MAKFTNGQIMVDAVQVRSVHLSTADESVGVRVYDGSPFTDRRCGWVKDAMIDGTLTPTAPEANKPVKWQVRTAEGMVTVEPGDWIIRGLNGAICPCKPDIFAKTYEPAEGEE